MAHVLIFGTSLDTDPEGISEYGVSTMRGVVKWAVGWWGDKIGGNLDDGRSEGKIDEVQQRTAVGAFAQSSSPNEVQALRWQVYTTHLSSPTNKVVFWLVPPRKVLSMDLVPPKKEKIIKFAEDGKNPYKKWRSKSKYVRPSLFAVT